MVASPNIGIATLYRGIQFRSRLEAKWAAFFDSLDWRWEYEPFDLNGYIPDFVLDFPHEPLLVEVKPSLHLSECKAATPKIERSGWDHEAIVVGARLLDPAHWAAPAMGLLGERNDSPDGRDYWWGDGILFWCLHCKRLSIHHAYGHYKCRVSGCYDGDGHIGVLEHHEDIQGRWAAACNSVQWKAPHH